MPESIDAVVVGAGPAGLASAIVLARNGLKVLVCDKGELPIDKPCGEGLLPIGVEHLRQLDAIKHLDTNDLHRFCGIQYHSPSGYVASARFAEGDGLGIRRVNLSRALLRVASEHRDIEVVERTIVRRLNPTSEGTLLSLGRRKIIARLLVGADGLNSRIRRWAGLEGAAQRSLRMGARQHFEISPWSDYVEVRTGRGIESYVTPCGRGHIGVAFLWDQRNFPSLRGGQAMIESLLVQFPDLQRRLAAIKTCSVPRGTGPLHRVTLGRCADGVILIGDAGGYLDACTGEGISLAFAQALCLEQSVIPILKNNANKPLKDQLTSYETACRKITQAYYLGTRFQLLVNRYPLVADQVTYAFAKNPDVLQHFLSANMGKASFWPGWAKSMRLLIGILGLAQRPRQVARF